MSTSSQQMLADACAKGLLSKTAADMVEAEREKLVKQAMRECALELVELVKIAGLGSIIDRFRKAPAAVAKPIENAGGLLSKLRRGNATGGAGGASWGDVTSNLGKMMALAGLSAGATAGIQGLMRHRRDKQVNNDIQSSYQQMFDEYPRLKQMEEEHPGRVARHFGVLSQFAPSLAAVPTVAGAFVQSHTQMNMIDSATIKNLAETQTRIDEMHEHRHGTRGISPINVGTLATKAMFT